MDHDRVIYRLPSVGAAREKDTCQGNWRNTSHNMR